MARPEEKRSRRRRPWRCEFSPIESSMESSRRVPSTARSRRHEPVARDQSRQESMDAPERHLTDADFEAAAEHLDALVQEFEALPFPQVRERVFDLLQTVDAVHREGLCRL